MLAHSGSFRLIPAYSPSQIRSASNVSNAGMGFPDEMKPLKNDHPSYSCERTQWVLVTGVGPLNFFWLRPPGIPNGLENSVHAWWQRRALHTSDTGFLQTSCSA
jgi:hypothetical protein